MIQVVERGREVDHEEGACTPCSTYPAPSSILKRKLHQPPNLHFSKARYHNWDAFDVPLNAPDLGRLPWAGAPT